MYFRSVYLETLKGYATLKQQHNVLASGNFPAYNQVLQVGSAAKSSIVQVFTDQGGGGTGFFITSGGCVVTNAHVTADAKSVTVRLIDGKEFPATLVKEGNLADVDLAVLKVNGSNYPSFTINTLPPASGDAILAIGQPGDLGNWVISAGHFVSYTNTTNATGGPQPTLIISAPLGPGNSGSPVITMDGNVVGVIAGDKPWLSKGITASDNIVVDAKNAGYYWVVGPRQATAVPSSTLLKFVEGTPCKPNTYVQSATSTQTLNVPQNVTFSDLAKLYGNYTDLLQDYKNLASAKSQFANYPALLTLAAKTKPSVVQIDFVIKGQSALNQSAVVKGAGTGFLISSNGCVITNRHVVAKARILGDQTSQFGIQLHNGTELQATLVKLANESEPDLAILRANGSGFNALTIDPTVPSQGAAIFTVGHPARFGSWATSTGKFAMVGQDSSGSVLKSSLPAGEGNSGSPMLNLNGAVAGVVWGGTPGNSSIGPSDNLVVWMDNAGLYFVRGTYANAVPSQALMVFLKDTSCQVPVSQSAAGQVSQGLLPLPALYPQYAAIVLLLLASCAAIIDRLRRFGNRGQM